MKENILKYVGNAIFGLVCLQGLVALVQVIRGTPMWSQEAAGWAQAIGSVGTIFVTVILFKRQVDGLAKHAAQERNLNVFQTQSSCYAISVAAVDMVRELHHAFTGFETDMIDLDKYFEGKYRPQAFNHIQDALAAIPLHELRSYDMSRGILEIRSAVDMAEVLSAEIKEMKFAVNWLSEMEPQVLEMMEIADYGIRQVEEGLEKSRKQLRIKLF
ncbi:hypothetical protein [Undibacterium sp. TJN19]|uniref:hypothetical protein n=1 Tax=Undibacterium sp. TJN19 TaxID=3413055 RepID=UPI003BEFBD1C